MEAEFDRAQLGLFAKATFWPGAALVVATLVAAFTFAKNVVGNPWAIWNSLAFALGWLLLTVAFVAWLYRSTLPR